MMEYLLFYRKCKALTPRRPMFLYECQKTLRMCCLRLAKHAKPHLFTGMYPIVLIASIAVVSTINRHVSISLLICNKTLQLSITCTDFRRTFFKRFRGLRSRSEETANHNNIHVAPRRSLFEVQCKQLNIFGQVNCSEQLIPQR